MSKDFGELDLFENAPVTLRLLDIMTKTNLNLYEFIFMADKSQFLLKSKILNATGSLDEYFPGLMNEANKFRNELRDQGITPIEVPQPDYSNVFGFISSVSSNLYDFTNSTVSYAAQKYNEFRDSKFVSNFSEKLSENLLSSIVTMPLNNSFDDFRKNFIKKLIKTSINLPANSGLAYLTNRNEKDLKSFTKVFIDSILKESNKSWTQSVAEASLSGAATLINDKNFSWLNNSNLKEIFAYGVSGFLQDYTVQGFVSGAAKEAVKINLREILNYSYKNRKDDPLLNSKIITIEGVSNLFKELDKSNPLLSGMALGPMIALNLYLAAQKDSNPIVQDVQNELSINIAKNAAKNVTNELLNVNHDSEIARNSDRKEPIIKKGLSR